jgi:hypothetical protein
VRAVLFIAGLIAFGSASSHARACQCGTKPSAREALKLAAHVFVGTVVAIEPAPAGFGLGLNPPSSAVQRTVFRVGPRWKGAIVRELSAYLGGNCSYIFERGRSYLVFLTVSPHAPDRPEASICLPNQPLSAVTASAQGIALLGPVLPSP